MEFEASIDESSESGGHDPQARIVTLDILPTATGTDFSLSLGCIGGYRAGYFTSYSGLVPSSIDTYFIGIYNSDTRKWTEATKVYRNPIFTKDQSGIRINSQTQMRQIVQVLETANQNQHPDLVLGTGMYDSEDDDVQLWSEFDPVGLEEALQYLPCYSESEPAVQVIYAIPSDRQYNAQYRTVVEEAILHVQSWYADQLDGQTFILADPVPLICEVGEPAAYYEGKDGWDRTIDAVQHCAPVEHWSEEYVWVIYIDAGPDCSNREQNELSRGAAGITILGGWQLEGLLTTSTYLACSDEDDNPRGAYGWIGGLAHELGHALGLEHPPGYDAAFARLWEGSITTWPENLSDSGTIMWLGYDDYPETYFTDGDIAILKSSPFIIPREARD